MSLFSHDWRPPTLETERLILRPFVEADAEPIFRHACNPNVTRFTLWAHHQTLADSFMFVRDYARFRYLEGLPEPYAVCLKNDDVPIGAVGCFWASEPNRTMELGYWIGERFWGRGIAVEASEAVVTQAFTMCRPGRMQARVIAGNDASVRVLNKLGFHYEGTLRSSLFRRGALEDVMIFSQMPREHPHTSITEHLM